MPFKLFVDDVQQETDSAGVALIDRGHRELPLAADYTGHARTVLDDPDYTADVFSRLRPTVPGWLPSWLNAKLVVVTLTED